MKYDYSELRGRIYSKCRNISKFSEALGLTRSTLYSKLDGKSQFTVEEVEKCMKLLEIPKDKIFDYFFIR